MTLALLCLAVSSAWGQATQRGVVVVSKNDVTKVNDTDITTDGQVESAGEKTTVTVKVTPQAGKVAKVTVRPTTVAATGVTSIEGASSVDINSTITLTANVQPTYANTVVWTVSDTGKAAFVTSGTETVSTVTTNVDATTGQTTATLKGIASGSVTVSVKATSEASTALATDNITVVALTTYTAPTMRTSSSSYNGSTQNLYATAGSATNGTMYYSYRYHTIGGSYGSWSSWITTAPTGINAGVYEVKYKVEPDAGYSGGISETSIGEFTINKIDWPGSVEIQMGGGGFYRGHWTGDGTIFKWEYKLNSNSSWENANGTTNTPNTSANVKGKIFRVTVAADDNHNETVREGYYN